MAENDTITESTADTTTPTAPHIAVAGLATPSFEAVEIPIRNLRGVANILAWGQGGTLSDDALELLAGDMERAIGEIETAARRAAA